MGRSALLAALVLVLGVVAGGVGPAASATAAAPADLARTKAELDRLALQRGAPAEVSAWWVDAATDSVVLALNGRPRDARATAYVDDARALGPAVRVVSGVPALAPRGARLAPAPTAPTAPGKPYDLVGGDAIFLGGARCSIGFGARTLAGAPRMITAGHCTAAGGEVRGANNVRIGPTRSSVFDRTGDWGVVDVEPTWTPTSQVAAGGPATLRVTGTATAAVGTPVCRSGSTTGWHCGTVTATDVTANYDSGPVTGLTLTSACSDGGDSGGSFVAGSAAVGTLSGGSGDCRTSGGTSLYQPIEEVLRAEGLSLVVGP